MSKNKKNEFVLADNVWNRVVQIVQEGIIMGVDVSDLLRQIRICQTDENTNVFDLSEGYRKQVKVGHQKMLVEAERLKKEQQDKQIPIKFGLIKDDIDRAGTD